MSKSQIATRKVDFQDGVSFDFYKPRLDHGTDMVYFDPSMTRQEFQDECDINTIMEKYEKTGILPSNTRGPPQYVDLSGMPSDYMTALNMLNDAEKAFMSLPATVRREFENSPHEFVKFASDPENLTQMQDWGLAPKPEAAPPGPPTPAPAPKGPEPAPPPKAP